MVSSSLTSASLRPMKRLIEKIVFSGFITAWRFATVPTRRSPDSVKATTDGVVLPPSAFSRTVGSRPSSTATHELVVPRSIPIVLPTSYLQVLFDLPLQNLSVSMADPVWPLNPDFAPGSEANRHIVGCACSGPGDAGVRAG